VKKSGELMRDIASANALEPARVAAVDEALAREVFG